MKKRKKMIKTAKSLKRWMTVMKMMNLKLLKTIP